jgi:hypothetical protein
MGGRDGQYTESNTHIPEPEPLANPIQAIDDGNNSISQVEYVKTLEMVVNAIEKN